MDVIGRSIDIIFDRNVTFHNNDRSYIVLQYGSLNHHSTPSMFNSWQQTVPVINLFWHSTDVRRNEISSDQMILFHWSAPNFYEFDTFLFLLTAFIYKRMFFKLQLFQKNFFVEFSSYRLCVHRLCQYDIYSGHFWSCRLLIFYYVTL